MVRGRGAFDPAEAVVWATASLLALLCGLGTGFVLWSALVETGAPVAWRAIAYGTALVLAAVASGRHPVPLRLFLGIAAAALLASFAFGYALFAPLLGS